MPLNFLSTFLLQVHPFDKRLNQVYAYAEKYRLPVTTHCARGGVFYKGEITGDMLVHPKTGVHLKSQKNKFFTDTYTDPANYEYVLQEFPNLKINLAHLVVMMNGISIWIQL